MKPYVLMVGSHPKRVIGGIAAMIETILASPLTEQFEIEHIASVIDGSKQQKLWTVTVALNRFLRRLLTRRVSVVYIHVGGDKSIYRKTAFILLAKLFNKKVLVHFHGGNMARYYDSRHRLGRWYLRTVLRLSDRVLAVSEAARIAHQRFLPNYNIHVLRNAVNAPAFCASCRRSAKRDSVRVIYMGHLRSEKGTYDLLEAIPQITAALPGARFFLCGNRDVEQVRDICRRNGFMPFIEHLGPVSIDERWTFLRQADVFVLPSYEEGLPVSLLEAMAVGLPVVTTPVGGIPEVIRDGVNAFFIQPGDIHGLAARVLQLAQDQALRHRMGESNRARITEEFSTARFVRELADHLQCLIAAPSSRLSSLKKAIPESQATRR